MNARTIIVGGGITGLTTAYALVARGIEVELLEASSRLGGIIRTEHVNGFTIEAGPDSILVQKPAALELCEELGLGPRLISTRRPRTAFILKDGVLYPLPSPSVLGIPLDWSSTVSYRLLPWRARARLALERFVTVHQSADESVGSFFRRRFGGATVDLIAEPLLGGIHAGDIEQLSMRSLFPRLLDAETRYGSVVRGLAGGRSAAADGMFRSLASGMEELVAALEAQLPSNLVHRDAPVERIWPDGQVWRATAGGREYAARTVVLAAPAHVAAQLVSGIDSRVSALCAEVPYVSTVSVALAWPRDAVDHSLQGSGFVVARRRNALRITACTWVSSKWAGRAPEGSVLLRAYLGGAHDPQAVDLSDDTIAEIAGREIASVLGITGPPQLSRVYRWRQAAAQHNVGHLTRVAEIESRLSAHPGLFVAGSGFRSVGIPDCIADARATARAVALAMEKLERVNGK